MERRFVGYSSLRGAFSVAKSKSSVLEKTCSRINHETLLVGNRAVRMQEDFGPSTPLRDRHRFRSFISSQRAVGLPASTNTKRTSIYSFSSDSTALRTRYRRLRNKNVALT